MPYRMVTHVGKLCGRLAGAAVKHADRILSSLTQRWSDQLEEGEELTVKKMLALMGEDLERIHDQLVETESQLRSEIREDKESRDLRNRSRSAVRELLFDVKKICDAFYGPGSAENLFEEDSEDVPLDADEVYRLGVRVQRNMANPNFEMPPLKHDIDPSLATLALRFEEPLAQLQASLRSLHQGGHGSSAAVADKEVHLEEMQGEAGRSGRLLEAITSFAGQERVARRIRRSRHRGRRADEESEEPEETDETTEAQSPAETTSVESSDASESPDAGDPPETATPPAA